MNKEKLTKKQRDFIRYYLETGNGVRAALKAYDTEDYMAAHSIASENLQKPTIKKFIDDAMTEQGFDDTYLLGIHRNLLNSDNPTVVIRALDLAYKLKGAYKNEKVTAGDDDEALAERGYFRYETLIRERRKRKDNQGS